MARKHLRGVSPICYSINDAVKISTLGRTKINALIKSGELESKKIGRRRLIPCEALAKLLAPIPTPDLAPENYQAGSGSKRNVP